MSPKELCPSRDQLEEVMRGRVASPQMELLAHHVESCPQCEETLETMRAEDTFTDMFRSEANKAGKPVEPVVKALIQRMQQNDGARTLQSKEVDAQSADSGTQAFSGEKATTPDRLDFLAPPQGPDEIGRLGQYRVLKVLGKGGMGMVLMGHDPHLDRMAALKVMLPSIAANETAKQRFLREARTAAKLRSDHIVTIYQVSEDRGIPYLAMEYLEGAPLDQFLAGDRKLTVPHILRIAREIASGLADAHERGLVHRDIKPGNIWLDKGHGGRATILDFGLARFDTDIHITRSGTIIGTPTYMAPEQARGEKVDARADLFSLGCVLYRLCVGDIPFKAETTMGVLTALALNDLTPPAKINSQIPQVLSELIMKLLEKEAAKRPATARDVVARLQEIERTVARDLPSDATIIDLSLSPAPMAKVLSEPGLLTALEKAKAEPKPIAPPRKRRPVGLGAMVLVGLLILGAGALVLMQMGVIRFSTPDGDFVVNTDDPDFKFSVNKGAVILEDTKTGQTYNVKAARKAAGEYELDVTDVKAGLSFKVKTFTIRRGEKFALTATFEPKQVAAVEPPAKGTSTDPDRRAAEWVLSLGGRVNVNGNAIPVSAAANLPKTPFHLTWVSFLSKRITDEAGMANFKGCEHITQLDLGATQVTDAALAHFDGIKSLQKLSLYRTQATDKGLAYFRDCRKLTVLNIEGTKITNDGLSVFKGCTTMKALQVADTAIGDAGLAWFRDCRNLSFLDVNKSQTTDLGLAHFKAYTNLHTLFVAYTKITDAGLANFAGCRGLTYFGVEGPLVGDTGLAHLKECTQLTMVWMNNTKLTDVGMAHFKNCKNLGVLVIPGTSVGDAGLEHLAGLTKLGVLDLQKTKVTATGIGKLKKALPQCKIEWDGGVIEPTKGTLLDGYKDEREIAAKLAAAPGVRIRVRLANGAEVEFATPDEMPRQPLQVVAVFTPFNSKEKTALLNLLGQLSYLERFVDLSGGVANCTDDEFDRLAAAPCKATLRLLETDLVLTPRKFEAMKAMPKLTRLSIGVTAGNRDLLGRLSELPGLRELRVLHGVLPTSEFRRKDWEAIAKLPLDVLDVRHANAAVDFPVGLLEALAESRIPRLILAGCKFSDGTVEAVGRCKALKKLELLGPVEHAAMAKLAALPNLTEFVCYASDAALPALAKARNLKSLFLRGGSKSLTLPALYKLADDLPECRIDIGFGDAYWVTIPPKAQADHDRKAAEAVLREGGGVNLSLKQGILKLEDLPKERFQLQSARLAPRKKPAAEAITLLGGCKSLVGLDFNQADLEDVDLSPLAGCPTLQSLGFVLAAGVTDATLAPFKNCADLRSISIDPGDFTGSGLALENWPRLANLQLNRCREGTADALAARIKGCRELTTLKFIASGLTDAGLAHLGELRQLRVLRTTQSNFTAAGMAALRNLTELRDLRLPSCGLSDDALEPLRDLKALTLLDLSKNNITEAGVKKLAAALPKCRIQWEGGVIAPSKVSPPSGDPDRVIAELVLLLGGAVKVNDEQREIKAVADLPTGRFLLRFASLSNTKAGDTDLVHLKELKNLRYLSLHNARVTDAGLINLKELKSLNELWLTSTKVTDEGLAHLKELTSLTFLYLGASKVTDAGLVHLRELKGLEKLNLHDLKVTDAGLEHLKEFKNLKNLYLSKTLVTEKGVRDLAAALPKCRIQWDGGVIAPTAAADPEVLGTALNVYAITTSLGGTEAASFGFRVSATGLGTRTFNVCQEGAAVGAASRTRLDVFELLRRVDRQAVNGDIDYGKRRLQHLPEELFEELNSI